MEQSHDFSDTHQYQQQDDNTLNEQYNYYADVSNSIIIELRVYALGFDRAQNQDTFRQDTYHQFDLDKSIFTSYQILHDNLIKASNASYLKSQFFRICQLDEIQKRISIGANDVVQDAPPTSQIPWISTSEDVQSLVSSGTQRIYLAAIRYTKAQALQLSQYISAEEKVFLLKLHSSRRAEDEYDIQDEMHQVKQQLSDQLSIDRRPLPQFAQVLIKRQHITEFVNFAYLISNAQSDDEARQIIKLNPQIAKKFFGK
ncbi:hypothetical protein SS50377_20234 [Spironucleus salmonicida]|uniref:Uncharacterized protein n=1 Tax=Spironucleus salmonicida TaxID=348837 RepID=V6LKY2_9EUKA|nr:hypothetical protein SS50377_20234 [Spironucleus salmonicida]|eukprot:EST45290.1 Hypothetical protein SS50377_14867 [Spironucleus salmonicida]